MSSGSNRSSLSCIAEMEKGVPGAGLPQSRVLVMLDLNPAPASASPVPSLPLTVAGGAHQSLSEQHRKPNLC